MKTYFHLYFCPSLECLKAANPMSGSLHQRGMHFSTPEPQSGVKCPGCGGEMKIARNGLIDNPDKKKVELNLALPKIPHPEGHVTSDSNGNGIMNGEPIIYEAPDQEPTDDPGYKSAAKPIVTSGSRSSGSGGTS